jgi:hypothetical protein
MKERKKTRTFYTVIYNNEHLRTYAVKSIEELSTIIIDDIKYAIDIDEIYTFRFRKATEEEIEEKLLEQLLDEIF